MGKNKKKNKRKFSAKSASFESERAVQSTSNTSEVKTDGKKFTNDNSRYIDDIQAKSYSPQNVPQEKHTYRYSCDNRADGQNSPISESDPALEAIVKPLPNIIEHMKAGKPLSEMSHLNKEELNMSDGENSHKLDSLTSNLNTHLGAKDPEFVEEVEKYITTMFELRHLKKKFSLSKEILSLLKAAEYEEWKKLKEHSDANAQVTTATPELEYGTNELSLDLETDGKKKKTGDCDISADCIQKAAHTSHNVEGNKNGNKGNGCMKKEKCFYKMEMKNTGKIKGMSPQKNKMTRLVDDIRDDLTGVLTLQNKRLDEQMKECSIVETETKFFKDQRVLHSIEKESVTSSGETGMAPEPKVCTIKVSTTTDQTLKPDDVITLLNEMFSIKFEFYTNGNEFLKVYYVKDTYVLKENDKLIFDFINEKVQFSFSDGQIFVSTKNSEFDIYVRNPQTVDLKDTTHIDAEP